MIVASFLSAQSGCKNEFKQRPHAFTFLPSLPVRYVRCYSNSRQTRVLSDCPLCAMCGRLRVGKSFLHACSIGRCSHVFGLLVRHTGPLAIMPCADQVPVNSSHSTMRWHKWVVLIAGSTGSALRAVRPPTFTSRRISDAVSFTPRARPVACSARLWPSSPRPCAQSCWPARWLRPWSVAAPTMP